MVASKGKGDAENSIEDLNQCGTMSTNETPQALNSAFDSPTFGQDVSILLDKPVGSASISPCGRDVVLASRQGLHVIDLDSPYSRPRHLPHHTPWEVADVQWSPFAARDYWVVSTSNQKALVWNLAMVDTKSSVEHVLHAHSRAITDINFSAHHPDILATCAVDSYVHCWDLRHPFRPAMTFCDWFAGATQVKWNRQDAHILASSHDKFLRIWDDRKGAYPLLSIEAHSTKIYGVDWSRTEIASVVTCSLDHTIKIWDYSKGSGEPGQIIHTPFPVWRARHTPFGLGLLAMPQRGDHDLHLYSSLDETEYQAETASPVYRFSGHDDQVKEFLWRPRGTITESIDDRDFQLVSWGTDRTLRLHHLDEDVLNRVGYQKGMKIKRRMNFTRRDAVYKTFREDPSSASVDDKTILSRDTFNSDGLPNLRTPSLLTTGMNKAPVPFIGGYGNEGFMSPLVNRKVATSKDMDPIAWMRGVRIGKRETSPSGLHQSVTSILSPSLKLDPTWDDFESLGEEITHVGDKFKKITFDEVDMQRRKIAVSLSGPWGPDKSSTYMKCRIYFPSTYPEATVPTISLEKTASLTKEAIDRIGSETSKITSMFLSHQRSSLEAVLGYLLGEQSLDESLSWMNKPQESVGVDTTLELDLSSSDEDDEVIEKYSGLQSDLTGSELMTAKAKAQNNPPLPKACGALWADNGRLVCFFPPKREQEPSLLNLSLKDIDGSSKGRKSIFEGFGRFHSTARRKKQATSTLETIESGGSDFEEVSSSSSDSSAASDDIGLPRHHFMPTMAWRGDGSEIFPGVSLDDSQKSSSGKEKYKAGASKGNNFISIHDFSDLLPSKESLAHKYIVGRGALGCAHNARVARETRDHGSADVWSFVELLLQDRVPLTVMDDHQDLDHASDTEVLEVSPIFVVARRAVSKLKTKDSAIDLSYDENEDNLLIARASVKWGHHPFGRQSLVAALFQHYEQIADVQMLAMLSCAFDEHQCLTDPPIQGLQHSSTLNSIESRDTGPKQWGAIQHYYASEAVAKACKNSESFNSAPRLEYNQTHSGPHSVSSSTGAPLSDVSAGGTPPSSYKPLRVNFDRRESQATSISTSPEQARHIHRSNSSLSAFGTSFSRPFSLSTSVASSPSHAFPKKRLSPSGSYLGTSNPTSNWNHSQYFGKSSTITEHPKSVLTLSISNGVKDKSKVPRKPGYKTKLKNQDQFHNDGYATVPLLDPAQEWRYRAYKEAYAHLLYIWELPITRAEVLKHNNSQTSETSSSALKPASLLSLGKAERSSKISNDQNSRLDFRKNCSSCAALLPPKATTSRCRNCLTAQTPQICLLCNIFINGLSSPCLNCGHVLHTACRQLLLSDSTHEPILECISGCGCICTDHTSIEIPAPDPRPKLAYEDVSPALTVIGDPPANEQEQLRWYENTEWEDMAYQSLARNLRPGRELRPKGSQIWRGRKGSR